MRGLLVGYGSIGRRHLTNFHAVGVEDWAVVHTGLGTLPFEPPCEVRTYSDLESALEAETPTFAIIANPTSLHVPSALACARAGCHLVLEKPVSDTSDALDALAVEVSRRALRVLVAFQFRFHPALAFIRDLLSRQSIGAPLYARVTWGEYLPSWHPWEDWRLSHASRRDLGGGVLHIAHPLDYCRMLFGEPNAVTATFSDLHPLGLEVPESVDALLRFERGAEVHVHLDYWSRPQTHSVEITCTDGSIVWDYIDGTVRIWSATDGAWQTEEYPSVAQRNELFVSLARHFLDVVVDRAESACTLEDGIREVRIAEAIARSDAAGAIPITLGT